jgi:hypothetical protein
MVVTGSSNKEIARACSVSEQTVKHHLTRIFDKVGASSRVELAMLVRRQGLADPSDPIQWPAADPVRPRLPLTASTLAVAEPAGSTAAQGATRMVTSV